MVNLQIGHIKSRKYILCYLKTTNNFRLLFLVEKNGTFIAFTNANWIRDINNKRLILDLLYKIRSALIDSSSKLQTTIAMCTIEAQYCMLSKEAKEIIWI